MDLFDDIEEGAAGNKFSITLQSLFQLGLVKGLFKRKEKCMFIMVMVLILNNL